MFCGSKIELIYAILFLCCCSITTNSASGDDGSFGRLIIESESSSGSSSSAGGIPVAAESIQSQQQRQAPNVGSDGNDPTQARSFYRLSCPVTSECLPVADCPQGLVDVIKRCYTGDKSMFCGLNNDYDPFICCPRRNVISNSNVCGRSLVSGQSYYGLGAFPFVARIGFKNLNTGSLVYPCSGSVISKRVILTAAHCALAKADGHRLSSVRVGEYDLSRDPDCESTGFCAPSALNHAVSHVIVHPDYENGKYHHDIALLVLRTPLNYTVATQPICLQPDRNNLIVGRRSMIVGWGKMSTSGLRSVQMQFLDIPLTSWDSCLRVYGPTGALDSTTSIEGQWMCAGGEGRDACQGFGGAPLVVRENGIYSQIGIMSFGSDNCGGIHIPSVYTSISYFYQWIRDNSPIEV